MDDGGFEGFNSFRPRGTGNTEGEGQGLTWVDARITYVVQLLEFIPIIFIGCCDFLLVRGWSACRGVGG